MSDDDISIDEKRVYGDRTGALDLAVATGMGVVRVAVSGEQVGEFGLATQVSARDVATAPAAAGGGVAVATDTDVLVGDADAPTATGFGPAVAVGRNGDDILAAGEDGRIARWDGAGTTSGDGARGGEWEDLATLDAEIRALDGDLVAASDGVHRFTTDGLRSAGLEDVNDVAAGSVPHAATTSGLYRLGNGWLDALEGDVRVVAVTADGGRVVRGHAATSDRFFEHRGGDWVERTVPGRVTDVVHGPRDYAITADGTFLLRRDDGWHGQALGLPDAVALAVVGGST